MGRSAKPLGFMIGKVSELAVAKGPNFTGKAAHFFGGGRAGGHTLILHQ
jgi:hypothetical protein